jgi:hypothetical protein
VLTISEFNAAAERHDRRVKWVQGVYPVVCVCGLLVAFGGPVARLFPPWINTPNLIVALVLVGLVTALPLRAWARRDSRLVCPHCSKGLFGSRIRVVATRKCPRCDRVVVVDPEPSLTPSLKREEVEEKVATQRKKMWRVMRGLFLWTPAALALLTGIGFGTEALENAGVISKPVSKCVMILLMIGLIALLGWLLWLAITIFPRKSNLIKCPRCDDHQHPDFVQQFGRCSQCSQQLVADSSAEPVAVG